MLCIKLEDIEVFETEQIDIKCELINQNFNQIDDEIVVAKQRHRPYASNVGEYICELCNGNFLRRKDMNTHISEDHARQSFNESKQKFECVPCNKLYDVKRYLAEHIQRQHTNLKHVRFECRFCQKTFKHKQTLTHHYRNVCLQGNELLQDDTTVLDDEKVNDENLKKSENPKITDYINTHIQFDDELKRFQCTNCGKYFLQKRYAIDHIKNQHWDILVKIDDTYPIEPCYCEFCGKEFGHRKFLNFHKQIHDTEKKYPCYICGKLFSLERYVNDHIRRHHHIETIVNDPQKTFPCCVCGKLFALKRYAHDHLRRAHRDSTTGMLNIKSEKKSPESLSCQKCGKSFSARKYLNYHFKYTHGQPYMCSVCGKTFSKRTSLMWHEEAHAIKETKSEKFSCSICDKKFAVSKYLEYHYKFSHKQPFMCSICGKSFTRKESLTVHEDTHNLLRKKHTCHICNKSFIYIRQHMAHHRNTAKKKKPPKKLPCNLCGREFTSKMNLEQHIQSHTGIKAVCCPFCSDRFYGQASLRVHIHREHKNQDSSVQQSNGGNVARPFQCDLCDKSYRLKEYLAVHKKCAHEKQFKCNICGKQYLSPNHLREHNNWHMGVKPYACAICEKRFYGRHSLRGHIRGVHKKQYDPSDIKLSCTKCDESFFTIKLLKEHNEVAHPDESNEEGENL